MQDVSHTCDGKLQRHKKMCDDIGTVKRGMKWKYLLRQVLVNSGVWTSHFILGLSMGAPTVLVPQLKNETNFADSVTAEQASWLPSAVYYSALPWAILLPIIAAYSGRKIGYLIMCVSSLIGFTIFYCSYNLSQILISEVFQGVVAASNITISVIISTEYTSSEYRGILLTINSPSFFWGILVANTIGTFFHWKNIPLIGIVCCVYCIIIVYFWPESPIWLAKKGYFDKCMQSRRWLNGSCIQTKHNLVKVVCNNEDIKKNTSLMKEAIDSLKVIFKKDFYKPLLLSFLLLALYMFSGKQICSVYAIDILKKMSSDSSVVYFSMLILDIVTIISMYIGCVLAKIFKRRTLLLIFTIISELFLFSLAAYLYIVKLSIISESIYVSLPLFVGFSIAVSCGPMILSISISGELIPVESRCTALCITALTFKTTYGTFIKMSPYIFENLGVHGTFLLFGVTSSLCLVLIYFYLPETKDKTLQEIADSIKGVNSNSDPKELIPTKRSR